MTEWFDAEDYASRALEMYERGRWAEAELELRKALAIHPDQPEWLYHLGIVLESNGRDRQARDLFERAAKLVPDQAEVAISAALACARLGDPCRTLQWLDQVLDVEPDNEEAHARRIEMLVVQGRHDEAETAFYLAELAMDGQSPMCLLEIAVSLIARGQYRRAGWCLREAMRMEPGLPRIRLRLAEVHASTGRLDQALQLCGREVREDPANPEALSIYADMLEASGRRTEAAEVRRRVLDFEPANVPVREGLARLLASLGQYERAMVEWQIVRKLDPGHLGVDLALGEVEMNLGRLAEARISLLRAHERCSDQPGPLGADPVELSRLANLLLQVDLSTEAVQLMETACEASPEDLEMLRLMARSRFRANDRRGGMMTSRRVLRQDPGCTISMHNLALGALQRGRLRVAAEWTRRGLRADPSDEGLRRIRVRIWLMRLGWRSLGRATCWLTGVD